MQTTNDEVDEKTLETNDEQNALTESLIKVGQLNVKLKDDMDKTKEKLSTHCDEIKVDINEITQKLHERVKECEERLLREIEAYEKNFNVKFDLEQSRTKLDLANVLTDADSFLLKYSSKQVEENVDSDVTDNDEQLKVGQLIAQRLEKETLDLEEKLADENLIMFKEKCENFNVNFIGNLINQNYEYASKLNIVQLEDVFGEQAKCKVRIEPLTNGNYVLAVYEEATESFKLTLFDGDGNLLKREDNLLRMKQKLRDFKMIRSKDTLCMYFWFMYGYYDMNLLRSFDYKEEDMAIFLMLRIDENLNVIKKLNLGGNLRMMCSYEEEIYTLSNWKYGGNFVLAIYDWDLKKIEECGKDEMIYESDVKLEKNKPFDFSAYIRKFVVNSSTYFLLEDYKIQLMDRKTGEVNQEIAIYASNIFLSLNKYILIYDNVLHKLYYYDFNGDLLYAKHITKISPQSILASVLEEKIFFFDSESYIVYNFRV